MMKSTNWICGEYYAWANLQALIWNAAHKRFVKNHVFTLFFYSPRVDVTASLSDGVNIQLLSLKISLTLERWKNTHVVWRNCGFWSFLSLFLLWATLVLCSNSLVRVALTSPSCQPVFSIFNPCEWHICSTMFAV